MDAPTQLTTTRPRYGVPAPVRGLEARARSLSGIAARTRLLRWCLAAFSSFTPRAMLGLSAVMGPVVLLSTAFRYQMDAVIAYWTYRIGPDLYDKPPYVYAAHEYPPVFVQAITPLTSLPWEAFVLAWIAIQLVVLLALLGPRWFGLALLLPPVREAITAGNLAILYGGVAVLAARFPAVWAVPLVTKISPGVGLVWFAARREWRNLAVALGFTGALVVLSIATVPSTWVDWFGWLRRYAGSVDASGLTSQVPLSFWLRVGLAVVVVAIGARYNRPWVLAFALWFAQPVAWWTDALTLAAPFAVWLRRARRSPRQQDAPEPAPSSTASTP